GPRLAAVGRLIDAAVGPRAPEVTQRRDVDHIGILRIDGDAADFARLLEPHVGPRSTPVGGFVDAVAPPLGAQAVALARARPHDVGIARRHGDVADGLHAQSVAHRAPRDAAVAGLPDAAARRADVDRLGPGALARRHRDRGHATGVGRGAEVAVIEALHE